MNANPRLRQPVRSLQKAQSLANFNTRQSLASFASVWASCGTFHSPQLSASEGSSLWWSTTINAAQCMACSDGPELQHRGVSQVSSKTIEQNPPNSSQDLLQRDMLHVSGVGNVSGVRKQLVDGVITGLTKNRSEEPGHGTTRTERRSEPRNTRTERNGTKFQRSATTSRTTERIIMEMTGHKL